jgi:CHASE2 domain-containing sensor protein
MLWRLYKGAEENMAGWPDTILTLLLVGAAVACLLIAWRGPRQLKAAAAVYVLLP